MSDDEYDDYDDNNDDEEEEDEEEDEDEDDKDDDDDDDDDDDMGETLPAIAGNPAFWTYSLPEFPAFDFADEE